MIADSARTWKGVGSRDAGYASLMAAVEIRYGRGLSCGPYVCHTAMYRA